MTGAAPWEIEDAEGSVTAIAVTVAIAVLYSTLAILKGKRWLGLFGLFVPLIALVGAIRLAEPHSPWARRFYKPGSRKLARAQERYARLERRRHRALDAVAGAPSKPDPRE